MAHIWFCEDGEIWSVMPLNGHAVDVSVYPPRVLPEGFRLGEDAMAAVIRAELADAPAWVLLVAGDGDVRINGFAPVAGIRVLQDRGEVRTASSAQWFFSNETLARVEEFNETERAIFCGRCRRPMRNGEMAVRCPQCGIWYHQDPAKESPCWTYSDTCGFCPHSTSLEAGFDWTPED